MNEYKKAAKANIACMDKEDERALEKKLKVIISANSDEIVIKYMAAIRAKLVTSSNAVIYANQLFTSPESSKGKNCENWWKTKYGLPEGDI